MDSKILSIGLDLGSDSLKIAFCYFTSDDRIITFGKMDGQSRLTQIALPALAYYDEKRQDWLFADQIAFHENTSFTKIVKIKNLLSLLAETDDEKASIENECYYRNGHDFPKFFFPVRRKMQADYESMVTGGYTFSVEKDTVEHVCERFFERVSRLVDRRIRDLEEQESIRFYEKRIAAVHPSCIGDSYINELARLIQHAFGQKPAVMISSNKALVTYARHFGYTPDTSPILLFDMGEEDTSVVRAEFLGDEICIDGVNGHNMPMDVGGIDVDTAIVNYLNRSVGKRETIGSPAFGTEGHIEENCVYSKQYSLMKDIKKAKVILGKALPPDSLFASGVPVNLSLDLLVQKKIDRKMLKESIGTDRPFDQTDPGEEPSVANRLTAYMLEELRRPLNAGINTILISGGLIETYSLYEYLQEEIHRFFPKTKILRFDRENNSQMPMGIAEYERSVYAPGVGGAIAALTETKFKSLVSLSYATWGYDSKNSRRKVLIFFVERGEEIVTDGQCFTTRVVCGNDGVVGGEEILSTFITSRDIADPQKNRNWPLSAGNHIFIGEPNSTDRQIANDLFDIKTVSGGKDGSIFFYYNNSRVTVLNDEKLVLEEGVRISKIGKSTPIVRNISSPHEITIRYRDGRQANIDRSWIEVRFGGVQDFSVTKD